MIGAPSLAAPIGVGSQRVQPAPRLSIPSGIASLSGFDTRLNAPDRIAASPIPAFPAAVIGGKDRARETGGGVSSSLPVVINSSPTIVINEAQSADLEGQVLAALRQHGGELYDQWQREVGRRQRTEF
ncbi:MAG TPA: hypothetical protein VMD75_14395 [Candidatus Binataceae bacterium]|nr:hypothetical protein [Candidatus Binataceae bacterium]